MKKIVIYSIAKAVLYSGLFSFCAVIFTACPNVGVVDPKPEPMHYLVFKNKGENVDFFIGNANYNVDSIEYKTNLGYVHGKFSITKRATENILGWGALGASEIYLDYKNGDVDTLTQVATPSKSDGTIPGFANLQRLKIYFNGQLVKDLDFAGNPTLKQSYRERNCAPNCGGDNPILIELYKKR